ncbi:MAG: hypothetical protein NC489_45095, partial [Ruminococcus flavefaciens]|nr:hypothetical protein [Ruminococcus flavefaciens]
MYSAIRRILLSFLSALTAFMLVLGLALMGLASGGAVYADAEGDMTVASITANSLIKFNNTRYKDFYGISSEEISSYSNNGGERTTSDGVVRSLGHAFDGVASTFWISQEENTETFKNHIIVNFAKTLPFGSIRYKSSYYSVGQARNFSGYPTTLSVYAANGDDSFTLAGVCVSTPKKDFSEEVVFSLTQAVECDRIKIEFTETSFYNNIHSGAAHIAAAMDISFYKSDVGVTDTKAASGNNANLNYLSTNSISAEEMKIRSNGGGTVANAFDKNTSTYYNSEAYNTDLFTNKITLTFDKQYTLASMVYGCSFYTRDNGRNFSGFPLWLKVTATKPDGSQAVYKFGGKPESSWSYADFAFPEPVRCIKLELEFTEVTTFSEIADGNPIVSTSEIFLVKSTDEETELLLEEINAVFTDYAQYELNELCTADYLAQLRAAAKLTSGYELHLKPVLDRAEAILTGAMKKDPYREFSTDPNAKNSIEQNGNLVSYCRNTLQLTSFGTNRQVIGIGGTTGETITIYVDAEDGVPLPSVAFTQIYGAWNHWKSEYSLHKGKNEIVFPNFKAYGGYSRAIAAGGPIHIINPYTPEEQSSEVKLYIE